MTSDSLITIASDRPFEAVCARLPEISQAHGFGVLGVHDLRQKLVSKGQEFSRECRVFEVCSPAQAKRILTLSIAVSTALPCRIAVWEEGGRTQLSTIKPTLFLQMFALPDAMPIAIEVEQALTTILRETAAG